MQKLLVPVYLLFPSYFNIVSGQFSCSGPLEVEVTQPTVFYNISLPTNTTNPYTQIDYGCHSSEIENAIWIYFKVCGVDDSGLVAISLSAEFYYTNGQPLFAANSIVWGPLNSPYDCNMDSTHIYGCIYQALPCGYANAWNFHNVVVGKYYKMMFTNILNVSGYLVLDFDQIDPENIFQDSVECEKDITGNVNSELLENKNTSELFVYPNPAHNTLQFEFIQPEYEFLEIIGIDGKLVYSEKISSLVTRTISVENFKSGIYFIRAKSELLPVKTGKFIIE